MDREAEFRGDEGSLPVALNRAMCCAPLRTACLILLSWPSRDNHQLGGGHCHERTNSCKSRIVWSTSNHVPCTATAVSNRLASRIRP